MLKNPIDSYYNAKEVIVVPSVTPSIWKWMVGLPYDAMRFTEKKKPTWFWDITGTHGTNQLTDLIYSS